MSLSSGSPGLVLFLMPSSIAISMPANARYGLHEPSGQRSSTRVALRCGEYTGMRTDAARLRRLYGRLTCAPPPGAGRLSPFVGGLLGGPRAGAGRTAPPV